MGLCINCIYHENADSYEKKCIDGEVRLFKITHICKHPLNKTINYVTGEESFSSCYKFNRFEECLNFDDGTIIPDEEIPVTPPNNNEENTENDNPDNSNENDNGTENDGPDSSFTENQNPSNSEDTEIPTEQEGV